VTTEQPQVLVEQRGFACHVTIHRASEHNTMTDVVMAELRQALLDAEAMEGVRAIVITGAGHQTF
jgi:enoyl-CoA hydratase/carnithine racemase